jgi:Domain of unknown function (DUF5664)
MVNFGITGQGYMKDPFGIDQHEPGAKLDEGKSRVGLVIGGFATALEEVAIVGTYGANKYTDSGWETVPNGNTRYLDAMYRHLLEYHQGFDFDEESHLYHLSHAAWNLLAVLELKLR